MNYDREKYELHLAAERQKRGLSLSVIKFDPKKHPRDFFGRFRDALNGMKIGDTAHLPDGVSVKRGKNGFETSGGAKQSPVRKSASAAARAALGSSAASDHPLSVGGKKHLIGPEAHLAPKERKLEKAKGPKPGAVDSAGLTVVGGDSAAQLTEFFDNESIDNGADGTAEASAAYYNDLEDRGMLSETVADAFPEMNVDYVAVDDEGLTVFTKDGESFDYTFDEGASYDRRNPFDFEDVAGPPEKSSNTVANPKQALQEALNTERIDVGVMGSGDTVSIDFTLPGGDDEVHNYGIYKVDFADSPEGSKAGDWVLSESLIDEEDDNGYGAPERALVTAKSLDELMPLVADALKGRVDQVVYDPDTGKGRQATAGEVALRNSANGGKGLM